MAKRKLEVTIVGDARSLDRALGRSEQRMKKFGQTSSKTSGLVSSRMRGAAKAAAGAATAYASIAGAKRAVDTTTELAKTTLSLNKNLGFSVKTASQYGAVLKARGADTKSVNMAFAAFSRQVESAKRGTEASAQAFKDLGISQKELKTIKPEQLMTEIADGMKSLGDGTRRTEIQTKLFGRGWQTLGPILRGGSASLKEQLALAEKLGASFSDLSVGEVEKLIKAQRDAKVASLGLQIAFGTKVAPALTSVINKSTRFAAQMRDGTGAGGKFAKTAGDIAAKVKSIVGPIAQFVAKHPGLQKVAAGILAVGLALKALRFGAALTGIDKVGGALRLLGRTRAGQQLKASILSGVAGMAGGLKSRLGAVRGTAVSTMKSVGRSAGASMGTTASTAAGNSMVAGARGPSGGLYKKFAAAGRLVGRAFGIGAALLISQEIAKALNLDKGPRAHREATNPTSALGNTVKDLVSGLFNREGGLVFGRGGTVPAMLSSGEMGIEPSGRSFMVPGRPVAADNVPAMVKPGTAILTSSGQGMMAAGASISQALSRQAPHFAKGGKVKAGKYTSTSYGPPWGGINGTGITRTGVNLKGSPKVYGVAVDPTQIALGSSLRIQPNPFGTRKPFRAFDTGGAIKGNRLDFYDWRGRGKQLGWGRRSVNVARAGTAAGGKGSTRRGSVTVPAGRTYPLLGNILSPLVDDALLGGIEAGRAGTGRTALLTSVLEGIAPESTDYGTRKSFDLSSATPGRRGGGGAGSAGSSNQAKVVARMQAFGDAITRKGLGYTYGGWHPAGNKSGQPDCSGLVSNILLRGSGKFATRGMNYTTDTFKSWGAAGEGKHITVGVRGSTGRNAHTMIKVGNKYYESANSRGPAGRRSGWSGSFPIKRHPPGYRAGGVVPGRAKAALLKPGAMDPRSPNFVGWGLRRGGKVRSLRGITRRLAGKPGTRGAQTLTQRFSKRVAGRSLGALLKTRKDIKARIRAMSKNGLTGQERIQVRRLRGALTLVEDELGRPIGRALGSSDEYQDIVSRSMGNLDNELIVAGVDPESAAGRAAKIGRTTSAIGSLSGRRAVLGQALTRARATGNRTAVGQVQSEIKEVDDQILGLRADLTTLSKATTDAAADHAAAAKELAEANAGLRDELKRQNDFADSVAGVTAREALKFMVDGISLAQGNTYGQRSRTASDGFTLSRLP